MGELATPRLLHVCCHLALVTNPYENTSQVGYDHGWSELCLENFQIHHKPVEGGNVKWGFDCVES